MSFHSRLIGPRSLWIGFTLAMTPLLAVHAATLNIPDKPVFVSSPVPPMAMIDLTKDHQLYYKAYNDYSDLDSDGSIETTYKHSFDYYGYFDSYKCYDYSVANGRFEPAADTADKYCTGKWSGNFLNWVSMTRMDIVRKVLYGGTRSTDTATDTTLERSFIPTDAHSFAKYYNGADIDKLTPFTDISTTLPTATSTDSRAVSAGDKVFNTTLAVQIGDQISAVHAAGTMMTGVVTAVGAGSFTLTVESGGVTGAGTHQPWTLTNLSLAGISFCNTTRDPGSAFSHTTTQPPAIRAARGNYMLWGANERWQCQWSEERNNQQSGFAGGIRSNGNRFFASGLASSAENPSYAARGLLVSGMTGKADYTARVQVCKSGLLGRESCKLYPDGNYKPVGLLQNYGEGSPPKIYFGLMTGSYKYNVSGGVLRKNIGPSGSGATALTGSLDDEITTNNGVLKTTLASGDLGIIKTIDKLRLYGYGYSGGSYDEGSGVNDDNCTYQQIGIVSDGSGSVSGGSPANQGNCSTWGNPISEIFLETLRYYAGKAKTTAFAYDNTLTTHDKQLGLPVVSWVDPINSANYCSPLNTVLFSASVSSYDGDQLSGISDLGTVNPAAYFTKLVGDHEGITGQSASIGNNGTTYDGVCTAKAIGDLGTVAGICPEAPSLRGTYNVAGLAFYAHTNRIRSTPSVAVEDKDSYKVTTYGVQLATNVPRISIPVDGKTVVIEPAYRLDRTDVAAGRYGTGTIVDFRIVEQTATSGKFYVNWEDSNQGGDYDQDVLGTISYSVSGSSITVTTQIFSASTANPQGFGYVITGTNKDGPHFHSGIYNFSYTDPTNITVTASDSATKINASGGCKGCSDNNDKTPRSATYSVATGTSLVLKDPLYYAAKYGGFVESDKSGDTGYGIPDKQAEWDSKKTDGAPGADGQPDTYFYVNNPGALEKALNTAFTAIINTSSASAVATNSSSLQTDTKIFQATFNPLNWTGKLIAFTLDPTTLALTELWDASNCLQNEKVPGSGDCKTLNPGSATDRFIVTRNPTSGTGVPFSFSSLDATQKASLKATVGESDTVTTSLVEYLRGSVANEGTATTSFRPRPVSKLGDIVSSGPFYVGKPQAQYLDDTLYFPAYNTSDFATFRNSYKNRTPMLYVGANDGMLHGFDATTGIEKMAFVPSAVYSNLKDLSNPAYQHKFFVDGTPAIADAQFSTGWKTVLVGSLRSGGRGIFALDITDPANFVAGKENELLLWEFTSSDDADLGLTYSDPLIVKLNTGQWAAIIGNGYNNTGSGKAKLFVVLLEKTGPWLLGTNYWKLDTGVGDLAGNENGLSSPIALEYYGRGTADFVFAGDLKGNLWQFDLRGSDTTQWDVATIKTQGSAASSKQPVFVACTDNTDPCPASKRQAITTRPSVSFHPKDLDSLMLYIGTGKYLESADANTTQVQTVYGVKEKITVASGTGALTLETAKQSSIKSGTINDITDCTSSGAGTAVTCEARTITSPALDWTTDKGWRLNLPGTGERIIAPLQYINGIVFFNTFIPSISPCDFGGTGYLMGVLGMTGGQVTDFALFDTNRDMTFNALDISTAGVKVGAALGGATHLKPVSTAGKAIGAAISSTTKQPPDCPGCSQGVGSNLDRRALNAAGFAGVRVSWRELTNE